MFRVCDSLHKYFIKLPFHFTCLYVLWHFILVFEFRDHAPVTYITIAHSQSAYLLLSNRISRQGGPVFCSSVGLFHSSGTFFPVLQKSCANRVSIIRAAPTGIFLWVEVSLRRDAAPVITNCTLCSNNNWINWLLVMPEMLYFSYRETLLWYMCLIITCKNVILNCCASMCSSAALVTNIVWQNFTIYIKYRIYIRTYKWMIYIKTNMHYLNWTTLQNYQFTYTKSILDQYGDSTIDFLSKISTTPLNIFSILLRTNKLESQYSLVYISRPKWII